MKTVLLTKSSSNANAASAMRDMNAKKYAVVGRASGYSIEYEVAIDRNGNAQTFGDVVLYATSQEAVERWQKNYSK